MTKVAYHVSCSPAPYVNKLMRAFDLFEEGAGVSVDQEMIVTWKEGEVVTPERIQKAGEAIKLGLEKLGYDCFSVKAII